MPRRPASLSREVAEREQGQPPPRDLLVRPRSDPRQIEPQEQVEVVVHHGESAAVDGEDLDQLAESPDDPTLAMGAVAAAEPRSPHAARATVIPGCDRLVDELRAAPPEVAGFRELILPDRDGIAGATVPTLLHRIINGIKFGIVEIEDMMGIQKGIARRVIENRLVVSRMCSLGISSTQ